MPVDARCFFGKVLTAFPRRKAWSMRRTTFTAPDDEGLDSARRSA
jgi:hypothetical protein